MVPKTPSYRLHKPSGQAVVTLNGRDHYLGPHGSAESVGRYDRLIAEWLASGRRSPLPDPSPAGMTMDELILAYVIFAAGYYRKGGEPTREIDNIKYALRPLRKLYGETPAADFGPLALKAIRNQYIDAGLCRTEVNRRTRHVVRMFRWGVENEMVPPGVHHGLKSVPGLKRDRCEVRESEPVGPVPDAFVDAVRPHVVPQVWAMVELQRLTAMRPGEVVIVRSGDLDTSGRVWTYTPGRHKTEHHGKSRPIYLGPKAQAVIRPWLKTDLAAYLFSPREAVKRDLIRSRRPPGDRYSTDSYGRAVSRACEAAGVPHWHPNQLRHNAATHLRKEFGLDVARVILGHSSPAVTEVYAEVDRQRAIEVMGRIG